MLRQSAEASNQKRLESLAQQVQAVSNAKSQSAEELAATLEPLAQALAALSAETAKTLAEIDSRTRATGASFTLQLETATKTLNAATVQAQRATVGLHQAAKRLDWTHYALTVTTALLTAVLVSGFWLWLRPPTVQTFLDPKAVAEYLKPAVIGALRPAKGR
ncbi:IncQ-type mobilization protein MobB [Piscinibacter koreensis]|nr:IncQ-type mobilization protein MobB [Schlegelella koreensis]